jgi:hypothetical protein
MGFMITAAFWTLVIIHGFSVGWKVPLLMIVCWAVGFFIFGQIEMGGIFFFVFQGIMSIILMARSGITRIG